MSNGVSAQNAFRYQDWCAIYFLLNHYLENNSSLEYLICENDKLDFEIWLASDFEGYQVKTQKDLSARELNSIFKFFLTYIRTIPKNCFIYFIFQDEPVKSFSFLVVKLSGDRTIKSVSSIDEKYFSTALKDVDLSTIKLDYRIFSEKDIQRLVYGLAKEVLEKYYPKDQDLLPSLIDNFIFRLKDKIEELSSKTRIEERRIEKVALKNIIHKIISSQGFSKQDRFGDRKFVKIELPIDESLEVSIKKPSFKKPSILPPDGDYE
ncbi:hypothetical protein KAW43_02105 [Candidatus Parcubacteria bacterium]|nr:hypothetical protein [Candidatus Parcubacteria bacterium]